MRRIALASICTVAAFMAGLAVANSAFAASPEFKTCIKSNGIGGEFADKGCSLSLPGGHYRLGSWDQGNSRAVKWTTRHPVIATIQLEPTTGRRIKTLGCKQEGATGELTGPKTIKFTATYKDCTVFGRKCTSPGASKGIVQSRPLVATLVPLGRGSGVGSLVAPESGNFLVEMHCEELGLTLGGGDIGEVTGASGAAAKTFKTAFRSREGVEGRLQEFLYTRGAGIESEEAKARNFFLNFAQKGHKCLEEGKAVAECETKAEAEFTSETKEAPPVSLIGQSEPGKNFDPECQEYVITTRTRGTAIKIV